MCSRLCHIIAVSLPSGERSSEAGKQEGLQTRGCSVQTAGPVASASVSGHASFVTLCQDCCLQQPRLWPPSCTGSLHSPCVPEELPKHRTEHVSLGANGQILHRVSHPTLGSCFLAHLSSLYTLHSLPLQNPRMFLPSLPFCCCLCLEHIYDELHNCGLLCGVFPDSQGSEYPSSRRLTHKSLYWPGSCYLC